MTTFQTLENISTSDILATFNQSFSDYILPFHLTLPQLEEKIKNDSLRLELSAGAFESGKLVGFILHGFDIIDNKRVIYNAGTGVIPEKRGNKLTAGLYDYIFPLLKTENVDNTQLEVLTENKPAIKTYEKIGFEISRKLDCYKGAISIEIPNNNYEIKELKLYDWEIMKSFWDWEPSWQNSITAVENVKDSIISIGIYDHSTLLGYLLFNPKSKRVQQFAIDKKYRKQGLGKQLFGHIASEFGAEMSLINIDADATGTAQFLAPLGFEKYIMQYEMRLKL